MVGATHTDSPMKDYAASTVNAIPSWMQSICLTPTKNHFNYRQFVREQKPLLTAKYPFLSNSQIDSKLRSLWQQAPNSKSGRQRASPYKGNARRPVAPFSPVYTFEDEEDCPFSPDTRPNGIGLKTYKDGVSWVHQSYTPPEIIGKSPDKPLNGILVSSRENGKDTAGKVSFRAESPLPWRSPARKELIHTYKPKCTMSALHDETSKLGADIYDLSDSEDDREHQLTALQSHAEVVARRKSLTLTPTRGVTQKKGKAPQRKRKAKETSLAKKWNPEYEELEFESTPHEISKGSLSLDKTLSDSDEDRDRQLLSLEGNVLSSETKKKRKTRTSPRLGSVKRRRGGKSSDGGQRTITSMFRQIEAFSQKSTCGAFPVENSQEPDGDLVTEHPISETDAEKVSHTEMSVSPMDNEITQEDSIENEMVESFKIPQSSQVKTRTVEGSTPVNNQGNLLKKLTTPVTTTKSVSDLTTPAMPESLLSAVIKKATKVPRKKKQSPQSANTETSAALTNETPSVLLGEGKRARRSLEVGKKSALVSTSQRRTRSMSHPLVLESPLAQPISLDKGRKPTEAAKKARGEVELDRYLKCSQGDRVIINEDLLKSPAKSTRSSFKMCAKDHSDLSGMENQKPSKIKSKKSPITVVEDTDAALERDTYTDKSKKKTNDVSSIVESMDEEKENISDLGRKTVDNAFATDSASDIERKNIDTAIATDSASDMGIIDEFEEPFEDSLSIFPSVKTYHTPRSTTKSCVDAPDFLRTPDRVRRSRAETLHRANVVTPSQRSNVRRAPLTPVVRRSPRLTQRSPPGPDTHVFKTPQSIPGKAKRKSTSPNQQRQKENVSEKENDLGSVKVVNSLSECHDKENSSEAAKTVSPKVSTSKGFKVGSFYNRKAKLGTEDPLQRVSASKQTTLRDFVTRKELQRNLSTKPELQPERKRMQIIKQNEQMQDDQDGEPQDGNGISDQQCASAKEYEETRSQIAIEIEPLISHSVELTEAERKSKQKAIQQESTKAKETLGRNETYEGDMEEDKDQGMETGTHKDSDADLESSINDSLQNPSKYQKLNQESQRKSSQGRKKPSDHEDLPHDDENHENQEIDQKDKTIPTDPSGAKICRKSQRKNNKKGKQQRQLRGSRSTPLDWKTNLEQEIRLESENGKNEEIHTNGCTVEDTVLSLEDTLDVPDMLKLNLDKVLSVPTLAEICPDEESEDDTPKPSQTGSAQDAVQEALLNLRKVASPDILGLNDFEEYDSDHLLSPLMSSAECSEGSGLTPIESSGSGDIFAESQKDPTHTSSYGRNQHIGQGDTSSRASDLFDHIVSTEHQFVKPNQSISKKECKEKRAIYANLQLQLSQQENIPQTPNVSVCDLFEETPRTQSRRLLASRQVQAESNFTDFFSQDDAAFFL